MITFKKIFHWREPVIKIKKDIIKQKANGKRVNPKSQIKISQFAQIRLFIDNLFDFFDMFSTVFGLFLNCFCLLFFWLFRVVDFC